MNSVVGISRQTDPAAAVREASAQITEAEALVFFTDYDRLVSISEILREKYPGTEMIGTAGTAYLNTNAEEKNMLILAAITKGATASAGVITRLSTVPLCDLNHLEKSVKKVSPGRDDTVCIEFCTNDEEMLVSTMNIVLEKKSIPLAGGTVFGTPEGKPSLVAYNGRVYEDACAFMVIKNQTGKAYVIRENIYGPAGGPAHIATKVNTKKKELLELDRRPAADVYSAETGVARNDIVGNVLQAPLGRVLDDEIYISSMNGVTPQGSITNYKQINENDTIYVLKLLDYRQINQKTKQEIQNMVRQKPSLIFSVNCIYRYVLFQQEGYLDEFLKLMSSVAPFVGYIGGGEQYNRQHVNQTMVCAVFE